MDTLYESARDAASMAKKVSEGWLRFPSKPTCTDTEIVRYYRKYFISNWDNEAEITKHLGTNHSRRGKK
jgi:quinol monooxygenase YgiN